ncbi:MAG: hypothetical protein GX971_02195 [Firmicutes bacterium]|nr:hypothetical protein [Bacillota bacterium]
MECLVCQSVGKKEGLNFWGASICGDCEGRLMELAVDQPEYETLIRAFRLLWQSHFLTSQDRHLTESDQT